MNRLSEYIHFVNSHHMKQKTKAFRRSIVTKTSHSPAPLKYSIVEEGEEGGGVKESSLFNVLRTCMFARIKSMIVRKLNNRKTRNARYCKNSGNKC